MAWLIPGLRPRLFQGQAITLGEVFCPRAGYGPWRKASVTVSAAFGILDTDTEEAYRSNDCLTSGQKDTGQEDS